MKQILIGMLVGGLWTGQAEEYTNLTVEPEIVWIDELTVVPVAVTNVVVDEVYLTFEFDGDVGYGCTQLLLESSTSLITNLVNALVESGEFCQVRGHDWEVKPAAVEGWSYSLPTHPMIIIDEDNWTVANTEKRTCRVCGLTQTKTEVWQ